MFTVVGYRKINVMVTHEGSVKERRGRGRAIPENRVQGKKEDKEKKW